MAPYNPNANNYGTSTNPVTGQNTPGVTFNAPNAQNPYGSYSNTPVINSGALATPPPVPQFPPQQPQATGQQFVAGTPLNLAPVGGSVGAQEKSLSAAQNKLLADQQKLVGQGARQLELEQQQNIPGFNKQVTELSNKLTTQKAAFDAQANEISARAGTQEGLIGSTARLRREEAISVGTTSAALMAAQGNLEGAKAEVDRTLKFEFEPIKQEIENTKQFIEMNYQNLTRADKIKADALQRQNQRDLVALNAFYDVKKSAFDNLLTKGGSQEQYDALAKAKTTSDVIKIGIGEATPFTSKFTSTIQLASRLAPVSNQGKIAADISNYVALGDYKSAYQQIGNTVSDSLTGSVKTKFDDSRADIQIMTGLASAIKDFQDAGGDTGILIGKAQDISQKLGAVKNPKLAELATQLNREFQAYRLAMTGAAFSPKESREYASVNPTTGKSLNLNYSVINGALNQLNNRVDGTIRSKVGEGATIMKEYSDGTKKDTGITPALKSSVSKAISSAISSGYPKDEIIDYLKNTPALSDYINVALKSGYTYDSIINYFQNK